MLIKLSPRIDFISPVSHLFDTDGNLVHRLEELEEGQSYVAANNRRFIPANYGRTGEAFFHNRGGGGGRCGGRGGRGGRGRGAEAGDATEEVATKTGSSADWPQKRINNIYSI